METLWQTGWVAKIETPTPLAMVEEETNWRSAAQAGDTAALARFYHAYQPPVYALCCRMLGRPEDAEDATQAAFVSAFRALPGFRGQSRMRTWLYRIAVNECLNLLRKRRNRPEPLEEVAEIASPSGLPPAERIAIRTTLTRVRPEHRAILILRYWEELSYEEIAEVLKLSLPAMKMRLHRARAEFERIYGGEV